ncbi:uncharacterized, partial [Tachysurus ichikawai]
VLTVAAHACRDVEIVPADEQQEEERQHEQLKVPHCQYKDLKEGEMEREDR